MKENLNYLKFMESQSYKIENINKAISDFKKNKVLRPIIKL